MLILGRWDNMQRFMTEIGNPGNKNAEDFSSEKSIYRPTGLLRDASNFHSTYASMQCNCRIFPVILLLFMLPQLFRQYCFRSARSQLTRNNFILRSVQ